jgi:2-iminobutanoate/2-iminopropanoate deaminase
MRDTLHNAKIAVPQVAALTSGLVDDDLIYIAGQLAFDDGTGGILYESDAAAQTEVIMRRIQELLASEGADMQTLIKVTIFLVDPNDVFPINEVYARWVDEPYPARSTIGVAFLALPGAKVEIEGVARRMR